MDGTLTILFYLYAGLAVSAPILAIPAILLCRQLSIPSWKGALVCIPWLGLPLFALMVRVPSRFEDNARPRDPR